MKTIRFYDQDDQPNGEAYLADDGTITYSGPGPELAMEGTVRAKGPRVAWGRFSRWSNGYGSSLLVTD